MPKDLLINFSPQPFHLPGVHAKFPDMMQRFKNPGDPDIEICTWVMTQLWSRSLSCCLWSSSYDAVFSFSLGTTSWSSKRKSSLLFLSDDVWPRGNLASIESSSSGKKLHWEKSLGMDWNHPWNFAWRSVLTVLIAWSSPGIYRPHFKLCKKNVLLGGDFDLRPNKYFPSRMSNINPGLRAFGSRCRLIRWRKGTWCNLRFSGTHCNFHRNHANQMPRGHSFTSAFSLVRDWATNIKY